MQANSYLFSIGFMLLILLYVLVILYMGLKLRNAKENARIFFWSVLLFMVARFVTLNVFMLDALDVIDMNDQQIVYHFTMNSLFVCDTIYVIAFFSLFRTFLTYKYYSHIPITAPSQKPFFTNHKWFTYPLLLFIMIQGIVLILYNTPVMGVKALMIDDCIQNLILIAYFLIFHFFLVFKFSGTPYITDHLKKNTRIITGFTFYFAFSRLLIVGVNIYLSKDENGVFDLLKSPPDTLIWKQFLLVSSLIFTEIIPFAAISSRAKLFSETFEESLLDNNINQDCQRESVQFERADSENFQSSIDFEDLQKAQLLENEKGAIMELSRNGGMGKVYESISGKAIRKIEVKQISQYVMDEVNADINKQKQFSHTSLVPILHCQSYDNQLIISYPFFKNYSLRTALKKQFSQNNSIQGQEDKETFLSNQLNDHGQFTIASKINIALKIAEIIKDLHSAGFVHGHLHTDNILLNAKLKPRISDLGLNALKKYLGFIGLYSNKSQFTSPENLIARGSVVSTNDPASDTYSFAYILFEIFTDHEPFCNINLRELKEVVVEKESRPKIPENVPEDISKLIRCCWYQNPSDRPNFNNIYEHLLNFSYSQQLMSSGLQQNSKIA